MQHWYVSIADAETGEWSAFYIDVPNKVAELAKSHSDRMTFLRERLQDERFRGRAMIYASVPK